MSSLNTLNRIAQMSGALAGAARESHAMDTALAEAARVKDLPGTVIGQPDANGWTWGSSGLPGSVFGAPMAELKKMHAGDRGPFRRGFGEFLKAVRFSSQPNQGYGPDETEHYKTCLHRWNKEVDQRVKANAPLGMSESFSAADGGVLIPPEFVAQILMRMYNNDIMSRTTIFPLGGNMIKIPAINETSRADGSRYGGVNSYWRSEAQSVQSTKPGLMTVDLTLNSLMVFMRVTDELLADSGGALEVFLTTIAASEIQFQLGNAIINGKGNGTPLGIMNAASKIACPKVAAETTATISSTDVMNMWSRVHLSCRPNAVWLYDQSIEPALYNMTVGGSSFWPAFLPAGGVSGAQYATLFGKPMIPMEFGQPLGTEGDLICADLSQYLCATRGGIATAVSMHLYFDTNEYAFRFIIRMDGKPWWTKALTPHSGGPTQSWAVTLQTRGTGGDFQ
jgi:HK97 family phage major capsid protein